VEITDLGVEPDTLSPSGTVTEQEGIKKGEQGVDRVARGTTVSSVKLEGLLVTANHTVEDAEIKGSRHSLESTHTVNIRAFSQI
jgi:hypothetical protein